MSLPLGKFGKRALLGSSLLLGTLSSAMGINAHAAKYRYEDLSALNNHQLVSQVFSNFRHDEGASRSNFYNEVIKELGFSEHITGEKINSYLDNRFDDLTPLQRIKYYMASMADHIGDPYNAQIDDADSLARLAYRGKSDIVINAAETFREENPGTVAMQTGQKKSIRSVAITPTKDSGLNGAISPSIPDVVFIKTGRGALETLGTFDHETGHARGYPNYNDNDISSDQSLLDTQSEISLKDKNVARIYGLEMQESEILQNSTSSEAKKKSHVKYNQYMLNQDEVETRLSKMKRVYFLATGVAVNSPETGLEMFGAFGVEISPKNLNNIKELYGINSKWYKHNLNLSKSNSPCSEIKGINFFKKYNRDVSKYCSLLESGYELSGKAKEESQLEFLLNALFTTPGLANNDTSQHLGRHHQSLEPPTLDFRDFMPGGQTGPDTGTIA